MRTPPRETRSKLPVRARLSDVERQLYRFERRDANPFSMKAKSSTSVFTPVRLTFEEARVHHAEDIAAVRGAAAEDLTRRFGHGHWSAIPTERHVVSSLRHARVLLGRSTNGDLLGVLRLATKKPWAIDVKYFTACRRPIYLTDMAVLPHAQRQGVGRALLDEAWRVVCAWPADAVRLDAYDAPAGAGEFYRKCGFLECGRIVYRAVPLIYYERVA
jgi:GNAT superfamily N-acetyltransferase